MSFTNLYYKRTAGTPRPCYVCYKPTTTVLATIGTVDFLYTCPTHLTDPGFASPFVDEAASKPALSQEDVGKAIADWEDRQKRKKEKKEKEDKKEKKDKKEKEKEGTSEKSQDSNKAKEEIPGAFSPQSPPAPSHERFTLHRDMFTMRQGEHRKRRQAAQAKDLAPRLPGAPRGTL